MGWIGAPLYGEDFATSIETAKKLIEKIESGKFDEKDVEELSEVNAEIIKYATKK